MTIKNQGLFLDHDEDLYADYDSFEMVTDLYQQDEVVTRKKVNNKSRLSLKKKSPNSTQGALTTNFRNYYSLESGGKYF